MSPPRRGDLALGLAAVLVSGGLVVLDDQGPGEWVFLTVVLTAALVAGRQVWRAHRAARAERRHADDLQRTPSPEVVDRAVAAERERLSDDIERRVRELLEAVRDQADLALRDPDPRPALLQIQRLAQEAHSELRRQLGLLRTHEAIHEPASGAPEGAVSARGPAVTASSPRKFTRGTVLGAAGLVLLATSDLVLGRLEGVDFGPASIVLTLLFALTLLGRRVAPEAAALIASALLVVGMVTGHAVQDGFSFAVVCVAFAWTLAAAGNRRSWAALAVLAVADLLSRWLHQPDNMPINAVFLVAAVVAGTAVGSSRRRRSAAESQARLRSAELASAAAEAIRRERQAIARELHDLVSHAVSVIAVQAGAAEVSWPERPEATRRAVQVLADTAARAQRELHQLLPRVPQESADLDLSALIERMRGAGLVVQARLAVDDVDALPVATRVTVYRILQEALTNVLRHSPGSRVDVAVARSITAAGEEVSVMVSDDGASPATPPRRGFGLVGLAERVHQEGGSFTARTRQDGTGFLVSATLPLPAPVTQA